MTAIVGRNSSGKTSLLTAVRLACDALSWSISHPEVRPSFRGERITICDRLVVPDPSRLIALADWRQLFTDAVADEKTPVRIELNFDATDSLQDVRVELWHGSNAQLLLALSVASPLRDELGHLPSRSPSRVARLREELSRQVPIALFVPSFYGVARMEEYRTQPVLSRMLGSGDQSHLVRNLVARLDGPSLERLNAFLGEAVGARIEGRTAQQDVERVAELSVTYRDSNGPLELSSAGTGLISLVALYASMERARQERLLNASRPALFLMDEPEAHLHPRLQGDVGEAFARLAADFDVQLLLATHSIEMINRLGRRPETLLIGVDRTTSSAIELRSDADQLGAIDDVADLTPFASLNFLASRRIFFYEGKTDYTVLNACAKVYFARNPGALAQWQRYTPVALDGVGNFKAHAVLSKVLTPEMFPKLAGGEPVRAAVVRDRDDSREPKAAKRERTAPHLELIDVVWSQYSIESLFLTPECLTAWLSPVLPGQDRQELREHATNAIEAANRETELRDQAIDVLFKKLMRVQVSEDGARGRLTPEDAIKQARERADKEPEVWQPGKSRAHFILNTLRAALPLPLQNKFRGSITDIVSSARVDALVDTGALIPEEIRALLDQMVQPAAPERRGA